MFCFFKFFVHILLRSLPPSFQMILVSVWVACEGERENEKQSLERERENFRREREIENLRRERERISADRQTENEKQFL